MAEYAPDHTATPNAATTDTQTAMWGLRNRAETFASCVEAGVPPSRAKAKSILEFEVTEESPQNHIAPITVHASAPPTASPSELLKMKMNAFGEATAEGRSLMASVTNTNITQPATALTATEKKIPHGALRVGSWVSSVTWAE